ncbi:MAG: alpha/beta hydrolase [Clostridiales bacterium]|nr:alpha/beta hydrolase [Clostridiales bacterium]
MYTQIEGIRVHYETEGEGDPVLLLHGWLADIEAMRPVVNAVAQMGMRAVSLDFPGFGKSEEPPCAFGVGDYARVTKTFMLEQGIYGADVICHSFGGRVAIVLASGDEKIFRRITFVDAAGVKPRRGIKYYLRVYAYKCGKRLKKIGWADRLLHLSERQKSAGSADYRALKSDVMRHTFIKVVNEDLTEMLIAIKNPSLLIWGSQDTDTPLRMARIMEKRIPDSGLVVFEGAGHYSYIDQYPQFCAVLKAFLAGGSQQ